MESRGFAGREGAVSSERCVFCQIVAGLAPAQIVAETDAALAIHPIRPVTDGHFLVIPKAHVEDFTASPEVTALAAQFAAEIAEKVGPCNLITSKGRVATQSVMHLHFHIIPRRRGDGLKLPWSRNRRAE